MIVRLVQLAVALALPTLPLSAAEPGLIARYTFDEASGTRLKDESGNGHDGTSHNGEGVAAIQGRGLVLKGGSYVDCGLELGRQLTADMTILAWVKLAAAPYPDGTTNWTLVDCEDYTRSGFVVRVDGQTAKLYYRASSAGRVPGI